MNKNNPYSVISGKRLTPREINHIKNKPTQSQRSIWLVSLERDQYKAQAEQLQVAHTELHRQYSNKEAQADKLAEAINKAQDALYFTQQRKMKLETLIEFCQGQRDNLNAALADYRNATKGEKQ